MAPSKKLHVPGYSARLRHRPRRSFSPDAFLKFHTPAIYIVPHAYIKFHGATCVTSRAMYKRQNEKGSQLLPMQLQNLMDKDM